MPLQRTHRALAVLTAGLGIAAAFLFLHRRVAPAVVAAAAFAVLYVWVVWAARQRRPGEPAAASPDAPRPATAPPDGHIRFTLLVEGLEADRLAQVWSDLCRPDRPPSEDLRQLFRTFTVAEGPRFRFRGGDPTATAALLASVLGAAAGAPVRTRLEPAAERTPLWS